MATAPADAFARLRAAGFVGAAIKMQDQDLPAAGHLVGVGEDEMHAIIDVESGGSGFDKLRRPKQLFEPHVFYRNLSGEKRTRAVSLGLAYEKWKPGNYPTDSYPRLAQALAIDERAACLSASWGLTQILGENYAQSGFASPQDMVVAMAASEGAQLTATVMLIKAMGLAANLKAHEWKLVARGWNGPSYAKNAYDDKLAARFAHWKAIPDTPWSPDQVVAQPIPAAPLPARDPVPIGTAKLPIPEPIPLGGARTDPTAAAIDKIQPVPVPTPVAPAEPKPGLLARMAERLRIAFPIKKV
ncbi:N-acetylmuramidase family protein [Methylobacterium gnaphalii]|uniref:N-acetylmuramidase domain-containing protein n=1 Tax=Methylobacterium gnaphalii TaxID=1010610 RepID=A0A512JND2_9HYPH|nr:N-acetylmuramidase family protein [Methylobacterium gnaphalii]GEP11438.1 hypothetical protein MGN01_32830 [Methylobacterium gnaphalii]GJD70212.1 hypothetical protein MMMDOFMJ_3154 [Methylobacterium gnaphalii]GLS50551.1 hypothetical protein GCM10007885_34030 [Methylobacterium gnaphalii]